MLVKIHSYVDRYYNILGLGASCEKRVFLENDRGRFNMGTTPTYFTTTHSWQNMRKPMSSSFTTWKFPNSGNLEIKLQYLRCLCLKSNRQVRNLRVISSFCLSNFANFALDDWILRRKHLKYQSLISKFKNLQIPKVLNEEDINVQKHTSGTNFRQIS